MNEISSFFASIDEPYAAGLFEQPEKSYFYRHCCGYARWFENAVPPHYEKGEMLYPDGDRWFRESYDCRSVKPQYCTTYDVDREMLRKKCSEKGADEALKAMENFADISHHIEGWTHGAPNYARIVREGLASYRERVYNRVCKTEEDIQFRDGLLMLLDAMVGFAKRCREYLLSVGAEKELTDALLQVPFYPARTYYEGIVCWNTIFYFDGCDNFGCLDMGLSHLYNGEDMTAVLSEMFSNMDAVDMWSCTIGPDYNEITRQALVAIRGKRRPLLELRVTDDMPDDLWALAHDGLLSGCTHPSFYNDKGIHDMLHEGFEYIPDDELKLFCGCGCTETNLQGITHAGGTDTNVNLLKKFEEYIHTYLAQKETFEEFFEGFCREAEELTDGILDETEKIYAYRAKYLPHPMRTLFIDDCIDNGRDYNNGGARYTYSMNAESGLINVIDCLAAVRKLYYEEKRFTAEEFLHLNDTENPDFYRLLGECPCFGTDDEKTDLMGAEFARRVFSVYRNKKPKLEFMNRFTLTEHQFSRYEWCGKCVGPTPDGRHNAQPSCDSVAAVRGKASKGPTAMLVSAARLPQHMVDGISVLNLTLARSSLTSPDLLKGLVLGYFALGGIQIQVTVTSSEELKDALENPDEHRDLIVRVGGYSEYFCNLTQSLRRAVVDRDVHGV